MCINSFKGNECLPLLSETRVCILLRVDCLTDWFGFNATFIIWDHMVVSSYWQRKLMYPGGIRRPSVSHWQTSQNQIQWWETCDREQDALITVATEAPMKKKTASFRPGQVVLRLEFSTWETSDIPLDQARLPFLRECRKTQRLQQSHKCTLYHFIIFRSPFHAHTFYLYMRDTLLSTSATYRPSISDFSCRCGTRRQQGRGQNLRPLDLTRALPTELTGSTLSIMNSRKLLDGNYLVHLCVHGVVSDQWHH